MKSFESRGAPHNRLESKDLVNPEADQLGAYSMHLNSACDLLNLALEKGVVTDEQAEVIAHDLRDARNASEVLKASEPLTRRLYQEAVDYSDILFSRGVIDERNYKELKSNLSRGKEFTTRDLDNADHLDTIAAQAASGIEAPAIAGKEILKGIEQMRLNKKIYPEEGTEPE